MIQTTITTIAFIIFIFTNAISQHNPKISIQLNDKFIVTGHKELLDSVITSWIVDDSTFIDYTKYEAEILHQETMAMVFMPYTVYLIQFAKGNEYDERPTEYSIGSIGVFEKSNKEYYLSNIHPIISLQHDKIYFEHWNISYYTNNGIIEIEGTSIRTKDNLETSYDHYIITDHKSIIANAEIKTSEVNDMISYLENINEYQSSVILDGRDTTRFIIYETINTKNNVADTLYKRYEFIDNELVITKTFTPEEYKAATQGLR